jgi:hypothetical protein
MVKKASMKLDGVKMTSNQVWLQLAKELGIKLPDLPDEEE